MAPNSNANLHVTRRAILFSKTPPNINGMDTRKLEKNGTSQKMAPNVIDMVLFFSRICWFEISNQVPDSKS